VPQVKLLRGKKQAVKLLAVNQPPSAKHISHQEKSGQIEVSVLLCEFSE
jgi:hypothetical protein